MTISQHRPCHRRSPLCNRCFLTIIICLSIMVTISVHLMNVWESTHPCITPKTHRQRLAFMVKAYSEIMSELNITHWVDYGTLLGALRYENIIIWDHDADVSYDRQYAYLLHDGGPAHKIAKKRYNMYLNAAVIIYEGLQTDIFSWKKVSDDKGGYKYIKGSNRDFDLIEEVFNDFNASFLEKTVNIPFANGFVRAPNPPMEFVKQRYPTSYKRVIPFKFSCFFPWNIKYWLIYNRPIHMIR
ncbi:unnamed protein product [Adineta ricciae]|uniref:LicD/FKTN/FKRP nucleotidyltransferase domain-containing protein n=1 Tax=Adineta ricciae TaxID=249248 RepID=A0A814HUZ1_ADIRI|nr:unnamed protein product [Adineta ricciae]